MDETTSPSYLIKAKLADINSVVLNRETRVSDDNIAYVSILENLAYKTYAPSTEASRLAGAGAGLNDND